MGLGAPPRWEANGGGGREARKRIRRVGDETGSVSGPRLLQPGPHGPAQYEDRRSDSRRRSRGSGGPSGEAGDQFQHRAPLDELAR